MERRLVWRTIACPPKDQPRSWLRLLEQGPESQSASSVCWGGVSSVMGSSELDAPSFVPPWHKVIGIKAHCLNGLNTRLLGWLAQSTTPLAFSVLSQVGMGASSPVPSCGDVTGLFRDWPWGYESVPWCRFFGLLWIGSSRRRCCGSRLDGCLRHERGLESLQIGLAQCC